MADSLLDNYNPLYDIHLRQYFALPHMQKHLQKMGLLESTLNLNGDEVYARHHAMMDMMLKNREAQLMKMAELRKKLDAAEKVEICRRIRSGQSPESYRRGKPSRSLSRSRGAQKGGRRQRRFSNSFEDKDFVQNIETQNAEPMDYNVKDPYKRLSANAKRFNYLHRLDDPTLIAYKDNLKRQLQRLERFREISFGPHSVARQPPPPQTSWFFRRRSILSMRGRKANPGTPKLSSTHDSRTSCPPTTRKRRDSNPRLPPIAGQKGKYTPKQAHPMAATKLPPSGKKETPPRGRPAAKRQTTSTTNSKPIAKPKETLPSVTGNAIFGGAVAAAATAVAAGVANQSNAIQKSPTPPASPVLETQRTIDRDSPSNIENVELPADENYGAHVNEAFSDDSAKPDEPNNVQSEEIVIESHQYVPEEIEERVTSEIVQPVQANSRGSTSDESEPEYAEEDRQDQEQNDGVLEDQDHHVYENEVEQEQHREIPEFKFDQYESKEDPEEEEHHAYKRDTEEVQHHEDAREDSTKVENENNQDVASSRSSSPQSSPPTPEYQADLPSPTAPSDVEDRITHDDEHHESQLEEEEITKIVVQETLRSEDKEEPTEHETDSQDIQQYQESVHSEIENNDDTVVENQEIEKEDHVSEIAQQDIPSPKSESVVSEKEYQAHPVSESPTHLDETSNNGQINHEETNEEYQRAESIHSDQVDHSDAPAVPFDNEPKTVETSHEEVHSVPEHQELPRSDSVESEQFQKVVHTDLTLQMENSTNFSEDQYENGSPKSEEERKPAVSLEESFNQEHHEIKEPSSEDKYHQENAPFEETSNTDDQHREVEQQDTQSQHSPAPSDASSHVQDDQHDQYQPTAEATPPPSEEISDSDQQMTHETQSPPNSPVASEASAHAHYDQYEIHHSTVEHVEQSIPPQSEQQDEAPHHSPVPSEESSQSLREPATEDSQQHFEKYINDEADHEASQLINEALKEAPAFIEMVETYDDHYSLKDTDNQTQQEKSIDDYELKYENPDETNVDAMTTSIYNPSHEDINVPDSEEMREWDEGNKHITQNTTHSEYTDQDGVTHYTKSETITVETSGDNMEQNESSHGDKFDDNASTDSLIIHDEPSDYQVSMTQSIYQPVDEESLETEEKKEWQEGNHHISEMTSEYTDGSGRHYTETVTTTTVTTIKGEHDDDFKNNNDDDDQKSTDDEDHEHGTNGNIHETTTTTTTTHTITTIPGVPTTGIIIDDGEEENISSI